MSNKVEVLMEKAYRFVEKGRPLPEYLKRLLSEFGIVITEDRRRTCPGSCEECVGL